MKGMSKSSMNIEGARDGIIISELLDKLIMANKFQLQLNKSMIHILGQENITIICNHTDQSKIHQNQQQNKITNNNNLMFKSFLSHIKPFVVTSTIGIVSVYAFCSYRSKKNQKQYLGAINADTLKDASRLTNESFGISWGFQADDTVMNGIDSGDLFFVKYDCLETLDPIDMIKCYRLTIPLLDEEYHAVGMAYRDENGVMSYFNQFGENKLMRYSHFVSLPYIKELMLQKTPLNVHDKLVKLLEDDHAFEQVPEMSPETRISPSQNKKKVKEKIQELIVPKEDTFHFVNRVLKRIGIIEGDEEVADIRQLLTNEKQVNIRTETNKILRSL